MIKDFIVKYDKTILLTIGLLLVILSICIVSYDKYCLVKDTVFSEVSKEISSELMNNNTLEPTEVSVITNEVEEETTTSTPSKKTSSGHKRVYIGYISINKINLYTGIVSIDNYYNNVNKNVLTLKESKYPTEEKTNLILASHSGNSSVSFFRYLYKLSLGDTATLYYKNVIYDYRIVDIYNVPKVGQIEIRRNMDKTTLTLITCTKGSKTQQTVYILELYAKDGVMVDA